MALVRPIGLHIYNRCGDNPLAPPLQKPDATKALIELGHKLERLTLDIPDVKIDDLPLRYRRHIVGVPKPISTLLQQVAHVVVCYHDHHV